MQIFIHSVLMILLYTSIYDMVCLVQLNDELSKTYHDRILDFFIYKIDIATMIVRNIAMKSAFESIQKYKFL